MRSKPAIVSATDLQRKTGVILRRVAIGKTHIVIERGRFPVAVIIPITDYERDIANKAGH